MAEPTEADVLLDDLGALLNGLMVPYSISGEIEGMRAAAFGKGEEPLARIYSRVGTFGYPSAEDMTLKLRELLGLEVVTDGEG